MLIILRGAAAGYEAEHTARLFFPGADRADTFPDSGDAVAALAGEVTHMVLLRLNDTVVWRTAPAPEGDGEYALCTLLYELLCQQTGITPPWGMMTGVRPVRIIHDLRAAGTPESEIESHFLTHFRCTPQKFRLARGIADLQRPVLEGADPMDCSVYAGIPFCPSRCSYCSFVSRTVGDKATQALVQPYVDKLCQELTAIRRTVDRCGLRVRTLYIGGGTPTSLSAAQLTQLMGHIADIFDLSALDEYTVEAGRPDCTDAEKLHILKQYGATRISINPQTFSDAVLANIGRRHTAQDIADCFAAARQAGHRNINMDLIVGLPGEDKIMVENTLNEVKALAPDSITVHSLAVKRAARLNIFKDKYQEMTFENNQEIMDMTMKIAYEMEMGPYYLYRQKNMKGNFENVGYAKVDKAGIYNILIMEEKQPIIALGAGGSSKLVFDQGKRIERVENVKDVTNYIDRIDEMIERKRKGINTWL